MCSGALLNRIHVFCLYHVCSCCVCNCFYVLLQKKQYGTEELDKLTAQLDQDYTAWLKETEKHNEKFTRKVRDELIEKADEVTACLVLH